jgi:TM2 domain-containing membrane protein YozV
MAKAFYVLPELRGNELLYVENLLNQMTDEEGNLFANVYRARRRDPNLILILTLLGFISIAGIQRFFIGQIGMGILYLLTLGLCFIGTIIDLINYQDLAFQINQKEALEVFHSIKGSRTV